MSARSRAYVFGDMDLIAPIGRAGIRCVAFSPAGTPPRWSRYVDEHHETLESWHEPEAMTDRIIEAARSEVTPPVLFYQGDADQLLVSRHRARLATVARFVIAEEDLQEQLVDKARFVALAARTGLDVPGTRVLVPGERLPPRSELWFPAILKPTLRRTDEWKPTAGGAKALSIASYEQLESVWATFERNGTSVVVQETIEGPESAIESYHVYVDGRGEVVGEFTGRKIRTWPTSYGVSSAVEVVDLPEVRRIGREVLERIGLTGVAKLDFKRAPDGRLRLLEINARFNLWHYPGALAGVDLPALVYADLTGGPRPPVKSVVERPVRWVKPWHDLAAARAAGLSRLQWLAFVSRCQAKSALSWRDPGAACGALLYASTWKASRA